MEFILLFLTLALIFFLLWGGGNIIELLLGEKKDNPELGAGGFFIAAAIFLGILIYLVW